MVLTKEQRLELLVKARAAKANKKLAQETPDVKIELPEEQPPTPKVKKTRSKKDAIPLPEPVQVIEEDESEEEVVEAPTPAPKTSKAKATPNKFSKLPKIDPPKCCDEKVCHEQPLITDERPQVVDKNIVIPAKKQISKPRQVRASTPSRTLTITDPAPISELIQDLEDVENRYRPKQVKQPPAPYAPIQITRKEPPLRLFDY